MKELLKKIEELKKSSTKEIIDSKNLEFVKIGLSGENSVFNELCFCLMTANFSATEGIKIQNALGDSFSTLSEEELSKKLALLGHRFPNARAKYVVNARNSKKELIKILKEMGDDLILREWVVKNIKGLGMKEASHFLRNIGYKNLGIIDFHIIDLLAKNNLIEKPKNKSLTPKKYLEIENVLREISNKTGLHLGELDLYLWYLETGKILK
ncbi:N-glycosylase/DNA lyase [archaeon]|nr:N-glycosylase/DNA lyase [archaeon]PJC45368.1 MAG: N-glycosylase [Candidatus Pacearchaeota archaeon CG_4_9_14_0_2_um_filter_30_8]